MKPVIRDNGHNVMSTALCAKCGKELPYKHWTNERGVSCYTPKVIVWNFCPMCGEEIEGYKEEQKVESK